MKQRLTNDSKVEAEAQSEQVGRQSAEFASVEGMLRHDAARIVVPPQLRERLRGAMEEKKASLPWWKRWFR